MVSTPGVDAYDPLDYESLDDPYPLYQMLRDRYPVYWSEERRIFAIFRYDDVVKAARDWRNLSNTPGVDLDDGASAVFGEGDFVNLDPPRHDALRKILHRYFTPRAVKELEDVMQDVADALIDSLESNGTVDLARDFAWEMPVRVISHILGLRSTDSRHLVDLAVAITTRSSGSPIVPPDALEAARQLGEYITDVTNQRPIASPVLSGIIDAVGTGDVARGEVAGLAIMLFVAGMETTASLIATALVELNRHPALQIYLRATPTAIEGAVEEFLRYDAPIQQLARTAKSDLKVHGIVMPAGSRVVLVYGAANRDGRRFHNADALDFLRPPSRHLAFGEGIHFCLGAPLARLEARIALRQYLARVPEYEVRRVRRHRTYTSRAFASVEARVGVIEPKATR